MGNKLNLSKKKLKLFYSHINYAYSIAKQIKEKVKFPISYDELAASALLGLLQAVKKYKFHKNISFKYYAYYRIKGQIIDDLRALDTYGKETRRKYNKLKQEAFQKQIDYYTLLEQKNISDRLLKTDQMYLFSLQYDVYYEEDKDKNIMIEEYISKIKHILTDKEWEFIELYYFKNKKLKQIGKIFGISESGACHMLARILKKLRRELNYKQAC